MPKALEKELFQVARKKHLGTKRTRAYVYGTLNKISRNPPGYGVQEQYPKSGAWRTILHSKSRRSAVKRARKIARKYHKIAFRVVQF